MKTIYCFILVVAGLTANVLAVTLSYGPPPYAGSLEHVGVKEPNPPTNYFYDSRSLVKTWIFKDHMGQALVPFAEPLSEYLSVGVKQIRSTKTQQPVLVRHLKGGGNSATWEIGALPIGTYMFRIIGAIPAADQTTPPKHLVISFTINDQTDGSKSTYVLRGRGVDTFYCVQEFGFHVIDNRKLVAEVRLLPDSETSLYTYNFEIHDILATCAKKAGKTSSSFFTLQGRESARKAFAATEEGQKLLAEVSTAAQKAPADRIKRDDDIWHSVPGINVHLTEQCLANKDIFKHAIEFNDLSEPQNSKTPYWQLARGYGGRYGANWDQRYALVYHEWGNVMQHPYPPEEIYSLEDFLNHKPLGNTGDRGWGVRKENELHMPFARLNTLAWRVAGQKLAPEKMDRYHLGDDESFARDMAFYLVRFAYDMPIFSLQHTIHYLTNTSDIPWRRKVFYQWTIFNDKFAESYDKLFPFIQNNQELATAVGRFIPWVKTPKDIIQILDTHLVQYAAKNILEGRYEYDDSTADILLTLANVQGNPEITEPWVDHMWNKGVYFYPIGHQPLPDVLSLNTTRDGSSTIGSIFYTYFSGPAYGAADLMTTYLRLGGNPKYDLRDFNRYPEAIAGCYWPLESPVAGLQYLGVGDVGGPSTPYGFVCKPELNARNGWRWTKDPKFAWLLANRAGRLYETDAEWTAIQQVAVTVPDPIMNRRSRVLAEWSGILEAGVGQPDFRFHRAAAVRVGTGYGHHHQDALDLRVWAHGLTMLGDLGQRGGYGKPDHQQTICHNLVQIDEDNQNGHSWVKTLADFNGVQYLEAEAIPTNPGLLRRQTILVDVDDGQPSSDSNPRNDPKVRTPNSYVFDVCRTRGGSMHTFCFHGCVDDMNFDINIPEKDRQVYPRDDTPARTALEKSDMDARYLKDFRWTRSEYMGAEFLPQHADWAATCRDNILQATWRLARPAEKRMIEGERNLGGVLTELRKFTRLHLLNTAGLRVLHGIVIDKNGAANINPEYDNYAGRCIFARKPGTESIFSSVVEPYAGEPFILEKKSLKVEPAGTGPLAPVAAEVIINVVKEGSPNIRRTDILYADNTGTPHTLPEHALTVQGEFAMVQKINNQIEKVCLVRGKQLKVRNLELVCNLSEYRATIAKIDYVKRELTLTSKVPAAVFTGAYVEIGDSIRWTGYEVGEVVERNGVSVLKIPKSLELKRTRTTQIKAIKDPAGARVELKMGTNILDDNGAWVANGDYSRIWRLNGIPKDAEHNIYRPDGKAVPADFEGAKGAIITLEIGAGQEIVLPGKVIVERATNDSYKVRANIPGKLQVAGNPWKEFGSQ